MTVSRNFVITCNGCYEEQTWALSALRNRGSKSILKNEGFETEHHGFLEGDKHYCPDCNDREKDTFYVYDGYGEEFLGEIKAWGIVDARRVAWESFDDHEYTTVKREKQ